MAGRTGSQAKVEKEMKSREMMRELLKKPEAEVYVKIDGRIRKVESVEMHSNGFVVRPALPQASMVDNVIPEADTEFVANHEYNSVDGVHRVVVYEKGHMGLPCVHTVLEQSNIKDMKRQFGDFFSKIKFVTCLSGEEGAHKFGTLFVKQIDVPVPDWINKMMEEGTWRTL
jgi:hypothetical protein